MKKDAKHGPGPSEQADRSVSSVSESERLRLAFEATGDAVWERNLLDGTTYFSPAYYAMLGYEPGEFPPSFEAWKNLLHPDDRDRALRSVKSHVEKQADRYEEEIRLRAKDGDWRWILSRGKVAERDADGNAVRIIGTHTDITARKHIEQELREKREELAAVFENAPAIMVLVDRERQIRSGNRAVLEFAASEDMLPGSRIGRALRCVRASLSPEGCGSSAGCADCQLRLAVEETFRHRQPQRRLDIHFHTQENQGVEELFFLGSTAHVMVGGEELVLVSLEDITERRRAEDTQRRLEGQIQQAQRLESLADLAGGIAHDFNNLLVGVLGNADLMLDEIPQDSPLIAHIGGIETAAEEAAALCRQMLAFSGGGRFVIEEIDVNDMVKGTVQLLRPSLSPKIRLEPVRAEMSPIISADGAQIRQMITNLIVNAAEAIGDSEGTIRASAGTTDCDEAYLVDVFPGKILSPGRHASIEISDDGPGIPGTGLDRIFDPFFTTKFIGRGLGLAAVLGIVRSHKGAIKIITGHGEGTAFHILLPLVDERPAKARKAVAELPIDDAGEGTVLVIDDEEIVRTVAAQMLRRAGYAVVAASDVRNAGARLSERGDDVICAILDLTMPGVDAEDAIMSLRAVNATVPIVISSGFDRHDVSERLQGHGVQGFISKPYQSSELIRAIRSAIPGGTG